MAFTDDERLRIFLALSFPQPAEVMVEIRALIDRETEKLIFREPNKAWRDVAADMIQEGRDEEAWKLLVDKSDYILSELTFLLAPYRELLTSAWRVVTWGDKTTIGHLHHWTEFKKVVETVERAVLKTSITKEIRAWR